MRHQAGNRREGAEAERIEIRDREARTHVARIMPYMFLLKPQ